MSEIENCVEVVVHMTTMTGENIAKCNEAHLFFDNKQDAEDAMSHYYQLAHSLGGVEVKCFMEVEAAF